MQHSGAEHGAEASNAHIDTDACADKGTDNASHSHTDGSVDLPSADVGPDSYPNCAADSEADAATHRVAVTAAHAATDALPDLYATLGYIGAHLAALHGRADGPPDSGAFTVAHASANLASLHARTDALADKRTQLASSGTRAHGPT